ncbi:MAG: hypothetical protein COC10_05575 [Sphingobium sp.]|jgi:hypothetical protein|nr:MAG: hypothetical protein COC10_05575 [Sphingobium sp.]
MPTITGFSHLVGCCLVPGKAAGEVAVQGNIRPGDTLLAVQHISPGTPPTCVDLTSEFSISATKAGVISNTTTNTTGGFLHALWLKAQ